MIDFFEFIEHTDKLSEVLELLFDYFIDYPYPNLKEVVISYLAQPINVTNKCFILYLVGKTRSGKSTTCKLSSKLLNTHILAANTTVAALRREIYQLRHNNPCLILDDWNKFNFDNNQIYQFLKNSVDRDTALESLSMSGNDTAVNRFNTYGIKIISSTLEIYKFDCYSELNSRIYPIFCKRGIKDLPQLEDYKLDCINQCLNEFWDNEEYIERFNEIFYSLKNYGLEISEWERTKPLLATGIAIGLYDKNKGQNIFTDYWRLVKSKSNVISLRTAIKEHIKETEKELPELNSAIICNRLTSHIKDLISYGYLPISKVSNAEIIEIMIELGYYQEIVNKIPMWIKANE